MSKIATSNVRTSDTSEAKGCGCGGHARHGTRPAEEAAGEADTPKLGGRKDERAREGEEGLGCCGGGKVRK